MATVSAVARALEASVLGFHRRPLADQYRYLLLEAVSVRIRLVDKVQRRVVLCVYGIIGAGLRELIDFQIVKAESEGSWYNFLWARGLRGQVLALIVTDGHFGLGAAIARLWPAVAHQRCWAPKLCNLQNKLKASQRPCLEQAKLIYQAANRREAIRRFDAWKARWQAVAPKAVACLEADLEELLAFYECPAAHHKRLCTIPQLRDY